MTAQTGTTPAIIVVGVDGSSHGEAALAFALDEAARTGDTVEMITAWNIDIEGAPMFPIYTPPIDPTGDPEKDATLIQDDALAAVLGDRTPAVTIARRVLRGDPAHVLVEAARNARLLVVGSRGYGPLRAALLGSVSRYTAQHCTACPVVVVPSHDPSYDPSDSGPAVAHEDLAVSS